MIAPVIPYAIRGAIWYQGESNGGEGITYLHKMKALIGGWRQLWGEGDFPFYYVQLAGWQRSDPAKPAGGDGWARLREAQLQALAIPNTGMAVIIDSARPTIFTRRTNRTWAAAGALGARQDLRKGHRVQRPALQEPWRSKETKSGSLSTTPTAG